MLKKVLFSFKADRIGPDLPFSHFLLYFDWTRIRLCRKKFNFFGKDADIRPYSFFSGCKSITIGERSVIRPNCFLYANSSLPTSRGGIHIGNDVLIGNGVHIYSSNHNFSDISKPINQQGHKDYQSINIADGCWIGSNAIILPGIQIGQNSVVAAGSVVTKNVESFTLVAGNPARLVRRLN